MTDTGYLSEPDPSDEMPDWLTALAIAMAIVILVVVFIWIVIRIEPVLTDFIATDSPPPTATTTE